MVGTKSKLREFLLDRETVHTLLRREFITESQSVIIQTETDGHQSSG